MKAEPFPKYYDRRQHYGITLYTCDFTWKSDG